TQTLPRNPAGNRGVSMHFHPNQLPCFTLWKNTAAAADGYVTGLEPGTNFPNPRSHEHKAGRVCKLPPQGSCRYDLQFEIHATTAAVEAAEAAIEALQRDVEPRVHERPES
ncbi:MAG: DUF4432 family protein, partial [Pirellulaceae bacterium]